MNVDIRITYGSPPCQAVLLTAAALDLKPNVIVVDLHSGDNRTPEYLKLNPQHTVPTLVDNGFALPESRAIIRYLVGKHGGDSNLYPKDLQSRAIVDHMLDFDLGTLYQRFKDYYYPQFHGGPPRNDAGLKKLQEALGFLNSLLEGRKYAAGSDLTIADFCLIATLATIDASDISFKDYPNVRTWYDLIKTNLPQYEVIDHGIDHYKAYVAERKAESKQLN